MTRRAREPLAGIVWMFAVQTALVGLAIFAVYAAFAWPAVRGWYGSAALAIVLIRLARE